MMSNCDSTLFTLEPLLELHLKWAKNSISIPIPLLLYLTCDFVFLLNSFHSFYSGTDPCFQEQIFPLSPFLSLSFLEPSQAEVTELQNENKSHWILSWWWKRKENESVNREGGKRKEEVNGPWVSGMLLPLFEWYSSLLECKEEKSSYRRMVRGRDSRTEKLCFSFNEHLWQPVWLV